MTTYSGSSYVTGNGGGKFMQVSARVEDNFGRVAQAMREAIQEMKRDYAEDVADRARDWIVEMGAVDTGALYRSVQVDARRFIAHVGQDLVGRNGVKVNYAVYVNEGTIHMPARPFWNNAVKDAQRKLAEGFKVRYRIHTGRAW